MIMPKPLVELVQQDVQVYSTPDDFFASFDDDSRARVEQWRAECKDVDDWLSTVDPKLEQEADGTDLPRLKDELCKTRVSTGHLHSPYADAARYGVLPTFDWLLSSASTGSGEGPVHLGAQVPARGAGIRRCCWGAVSRQRREESRSGRDGRSTRSLGQRRRRY